MTTEMPPSYPFPDDELIYCDPHAIGEDSEFTLDGDSYMALARMPEPKTYVEKNDITHHNPYRLCIHTPSKGSLCFLVQGADGLGMIGAGMSLIHEWKGEIDMRWISNNINLPPEASIKYPLFNNITSSSSGEYMNFWSDDI